MHQITCQGFTTAFEHCTMSFALSLLQADWDRCCTDFYPVGGWSEIYIKISVALAKAGVR